MEREVCSDPVLPSADIGSIDDAPTFLAASPPAFLPFSFPCVRYFNFLPEIFERVFLVRKFSIFFGSIEKSPAFSEIFVSVSGFLRSVGLRAGLSGRISGKGMSSVSSEVPLY